LALTTRFLVLSQERKPNGIPDKFSFALKKREEKIFRNDTLPEI